MSSSLWASVRQSRTPVTYALIATIGLVFVAQVLLGDTVTYSLAFYAPLTLVEPWRLITSAFVHGGIMHVMFNAYSLWVLGNYVERAVGSARYLGIVGASILGGCLAVSIATPDTVVIGASAGIFGLFAALFMLQRGFGGNNVSLLVIIGLNLVIGFIVPGISWEAHIGGLVAGSAATFVAQKRRW